MKPLDSLPSRVRVFPGIYPGSEEDIEFTLNDYLRMKDRTEKYYGYNENIRFKLIDAEEEKRLFRLSKNWKSGDAEALAARDFLITNHLLWVSRLTKKITRGRLPENEVISAGNNALMKAIDGFDPDREPPVRFRSYLIPFIRGEISNLWRSKNPVNYKNKFPEDDGVGFQKPLCDDTVDHPFEAQDHEDYMKSVLAECISELSERDQKLIKEICENGKSFADVGRERGTSRAAPQASFTRAIKRLQAAFKRRGVTSL